MKINDPPRLNLWTLRFSGAWEREYSRDFAFRYLLGPRVLLGIITFLVGAIILLSWAPGFSAYFTRSIEARQPLRGIIVAAFVLVNLSVYWKRLIPWRSQIYVGTSLLVWLWLCPVAFTISYYRLQTSTVHPGILIFLTATYTLPRLRFWDSVVFGVTASAIYLHAFLQATQPPPPQLFAALFQLFAANLVGICTSYVIERGTRIEFLQRLQLRVAQEQAQRLLLNVLPQSVAETLKISSGPLSQRFENVTVLFADLVGFTELAAEKSPEWLVDLLGRVFASFDALAVQWEVEKIKTIGDAYMAVAGAPSPNPHHARAAASLALAMQKSMAQIRQQTGVDLHLRIGLHSGPVVAGVLGTVKFSYDLWGDTVNIAKRVESAAPPDGILVTESTRKLISDLNFSDRFQTNLKGVGMFDVSALR